MTGPRVTSIVGTSYVHDLGASRAFYEALGFVEQSAGRNERSAWSSLRQGEHSLLLVTSDPPLEVPSLPLHFYFFVDDLAAAMRSLEATGAGVAHMGYPPHALGGEVKTLDPDGNTVLIGQPEITDGQPHIPETDPGRRFSLLREAATLAENRAAAGPATSCEIPSTRGEICTQPAEVKLVDSWGNSAWACIPHADEALINASGVFIANRHGAGLDGFLANRRRA